MMGSKKPQMPPEPGGTWRDRPTSPPPPVPHPPPLDNHSKDLASVLAGQTVVLANELAVCIVSEATKKATGNHDALVEAAKAVFEWGPDSIVADSEHYRADWVALGKALENE